VCRFGRGGGYKKMAAAVVTTNEDSGYMSSLFNYIRTPSQEDANLVVVAVLADETVVRLGDARTCPEERVFKMDCSNVEIPFSAKTANQVFVTDSGRYRVMTNAEYATTKRRELARTTPTEGMAALSVNNNNTAPIGCGARAKKATVIGLGPHNIRVAYARSKTLAAVARQNNNVVTYVVLGVANADEANAALALPSPRIFLAGAKELATLSMNGKAMRLYLNEAVLIDTVAGSAMGVASDGSGGVWVLPSHHVPLDRDVAPLVPRRSRTLVEWRDALNEQWRSFYKSLTEQGVENLSEDERALMLTYVSLEKTPSVDSWAPPGAFAMVSGTTPFGHCGSSIRMHDGWPEPNHRWVESSSGGDSVFWSIATYCGSTKAALRHASRPLDLKLDHTALQSSLLATLEPLLRTAPKGALYGMRGVVGPIVDGKDGQTLRMLCFRLEKDSPPMIILIAEELVRRSLHDHNVRAPAAYDEPLLCSSGFVVLGNDFQMGGRLWKAAPNTSDSAERIVAELITVPDAALALKSFRTNMDTDAALSSNGLQPGDRVDVSEAFTIFYTCATSDDRLCGVNVRWQLSLEGEHMLVLV